MLAGASGTLTGLGTGGAGFGGAIFDGGGFGTGTVETGGQLTLGGVLTLGGSPFVWVGPPWLGGVSCWVCDPLAGGTLLIGDNGATTLYDHMGNPLAVGDGEVPAEVVGPSGEEIYKSTYGAVVGHEVIVDFLEGDPDHPLTVGYDSGGRVDQVTDPLGNVTRYNYDAQNRLVSETPPDGGTTTFSYDPASGELNQVTAPSPGGTTQYSYEDDNGHWEVNKVVDPLGRVTTYSYDSLGRQVSTTDPLGNITTYSYDPQGHIDQVNDPDGSRSATAAYDSAGNITAVDRSTRQHGPLQL